MAKDDQTSIFENIFLQIQWQRFAPCHAQRLAANVETTSSNPVFEQYRDRHISKAEICYQLGISEKALYRTLVEKGELFGD